MFSTVYIRVLQVWDYVLVRRHGGQELQGIFPA